MIYMVKRNLKLFFRDKSAVFFSLLAVFIIIGLYIVFLGDMLASSIAVEDSRFLMDSWIMAGLLAVTSITTTMGAFGIMVDDTSKKISKDLYCSPLRRSTIAGGYVASTFAIGMIMSVITFVIAEIYIVIGGGEFLPILAVIKVLGLIFLSVLASNSMVFFAVSFFKTQNAFAAASTVIGTMIGFLTGIYIPIGTLPDAVQFIIKIFPVSHAAVLLRQVFMEAPMSTSFLGAPAQAVSEFKESMGVVFSFGGHTIGPWTSIAVLLLTTVLFFCLAILNISRKKK